MSEFSDGIVDSFTTTQAVFGTHTVSINGVEVEVVERRMEAQRSIDQRRAGRQDDIVASLGILRTEWIRCGGRLGTRFMYGNLDVRVMNDPLAALSKSIVTLQLASAS